MLRFESVFWANKDQNAQSQLEKKLTALGFTVSPSRREPKGNSIFFGPESIELFSGSNVLLGLDSSASGGIIGIGLESDDIAEDFKRLQKENCNPGKPMAAKETQADIPLWTGFSLPAESTPLIRSWVVMNSPAVLYDQTEEKLPVAHLNTCFGIEAIHLIGHDPQTTAAQWGKVVNKSVSGLNWNELAKSQGKRVQVGQRFFDVIKDTQGLKNEGAFMLTLRVDDLEYTKQVAKEAGAAVIPCASRDGFIISSEFTGGPALRFVRSSWKRYLPLVNENYPFGRRTDKFRPLGGADSSTLQDGFEDNWNY